MYLIYSQTEGFIELERMHFENENRKYLAPGNYYKNCYGYNQIIGKEIHDWFTADMDSCPPYWLYLPNPCFTNKMKLEALLLGIQL